MIEILIALVSVVAISVWATESDSWGWFGGMVAPICAMFGFVGLFAYSVVGWHYFAAEHKAEIINREFNTNYTQNEVFYAEDVIDVIREVKRNRIEVNGDLITGKD